MKPGRRPTARSLKLLRNTERRRPTHAEPVGVVPLDPAVPSELVDDGVAAAEWTRVLAAVSPGHLTAPDRAVFLGYCKLHSRCLALEQVVSKEKLIVRGAKRTLIANPAVSLLHRTWSLLSRAASELGLTPSSRSRVVLAAPEVPRAVDEFTAFQHQQRRRRDIP